MRHPTYAVLLLALLAPLTVASAVALAEDGGALPKGDEASPEKSAEPGDAAKPETKGEDEGAKDKDKGDEASPAKTAGKPTPKKKRNCFLDLSEPPGGNGRFSPDGKTLLLLTQTGEPAKGKSGGKVRYALVRVNPKTRKSEPVLSLEQRQNASLVTFGEPPSAVSAVAFGGLSAGCFEGPATAISVPLDEDDAKPVHTSGTFLLVETPTGRQFMDLKKSALVEMDTASFQSKAGRKIIEGDRPLWWDPAKKFLVAWRDAGDERGLVAATGEGDAKEHRLAFKATDRVIQEGGRFAALRLDPVANTLTIMELPGWSRTEKRGTYKLSIPPTYTVATAAVDLNVDKKLALVFGANYLAKTRWQRVFVFNYATGQLLGAVPVTGTQYLNYAGIDPTGSYAVVEIRDMTTRQTVGAKVFNVAKKTFDDLDLGLPKK